MEYAKTLYYKGFLLFLNFIFNLEFVKFELLIHYQFTYMTKPLLGLLMIINSFSLLKSQIGIGTSNINSTVQLTVAPEINGQPKGTLFEGMSRQERDLIQAPSTGLIIYNTDDNCLQVNNGDPQSPDWYCLSTQMELPVFSSMIFGKYKPIYPGLPGIAKLTPTTAPTYSTTDNRLYGSLVNNGNFAENDLFKIDNAWINNDTYTSILYNISGQELVFSANTVAYYTAILSPNVTLNHLSGYFIDGNAAAHYTEAQNVYLEIKGPAGNPNIGRKFLIGLNIYKEDISNAITTGGTGIGKENQSMLTYIFEFK